MKVQEILNKVLEYERRSADLALMYSHIAKDQAMPKLGSYFEENYRGEVEHMNLIMERITQLGGTITLSGGPYSAKPLETVQQMFTNLLSVKEDIVGYLNMKAVALCRGEQDEASAQLLSNLVLDEAEHLDEFEAELDLMKIMGCGSYLTKWTTS